MLTKEDQYKDAMMEEAIASAELANPLSYEEKVLQSFKEEFVSDDVGYPPSNKECNWFISALAEYRRLIVEEVKGMIEKEIEISETKEGGFNTREALDMAHKVGFNDALIDILERIQKI